MVKPWPSKGDGFRSMWRANRFSYFATMAAGLRGIAIKALLVVTATAAAIIFGEVLLRAFQPFPGGFFTWPPNLRKTFMPKPEFLPGLTGPSRYRFNSQGIRGDEFSPEQRYRVLTLGGSTTECFYQDQERTWPVLLERHLHRATPDLKPWVGNLGKCGFNTRHHVVQMKYQVPQYPRVDAMIFLVGCNDLALRLISGDAYDPDCLSTSYGEQHQIRRTFCIYPLGLGGLRDPKYTAWWRLIQSAKTVASSPLTLDDNGKRFDSLRERRRNALVLVDQLPDMESALGEYARNLHTIIDLGRARSARMIFLTQPSLWRPDLGESEKALLWGGGTEDLESREGGKFYSVDALRRGIERYNGKLIEVCAQRGVECIDLAAQIPKDTTVFFDDVHFTDRGSLMVADVLAAYFDTHGCAGGRSAKHGQDSWP